jgi:predicted phage terminase large subunit-like protein
MSTRKEITRPGRVNNGYRVGYGKPPLHSRFQPGESGNPAGRERQQSLVVFRQALQQLGWTEGRNMQMDISCMSLLQELKHDTPPGIPRPIGLKPEGSKADRMVAQSAKIEAGQVHLPKEADWLAAFLLELLAFPNGHYDDQVDSVSHFLRWAAREKFFDDQSVETGLPIQGF